MTRIVLYTIWFSLPGFYFLSSLWSGLERVTNKERRESPKQQFMAGLFCLACAFVAVGIDQYLLERIAESLIPEWLPLLFYQVFVFPAVLFIGAKILGPSKEILISKAPTPTRRKRTR